MTTSIPSNHRESASNALALWACLFLIVVDLFRVFGVPELITRIPISLSEFSHFPSNIALPKDSESTVVTSTSMLSVGVPLLRPRAKTTIRSAKVSTKATWARWARCQWLFLPLVGWQSGLRTCARVWKGSDVTNWSRNHALALDRLHQKVQS
jgi:hypothetical protein